MEKRGFNAGSPRGADKRPLGEGGVRGCPFWEMNHGGAKGNVPPGEGTRWPGERTKQI